LAFFFFSFMFPPMQLVSVFFPFDVVVALLVVALTVLWSYIQVVGSRRNGRLKLGPRTKRYEMQSYELEKEAEGETAIRRAIEVPAGPLVDYMQIGSEKITTLYENFQLAVRQFGKDNCLGTRSFEPLGERGPYQWSTYMKIGQAATHFGSGLKNLGAKRGEHIGIYSKNREEWVITDQACNCFSFVIVALYDTLGENAVSYIADHAECSIVVCSGESLPNMLAAAPQCSHLKIIIKMEDVEEKEVEEAKKLGLQLISFSDIIRDGEKHPWDHDPPSPEDLYSIMYTSGTTGDPKGVLLSHRNVVACMAGVNPRVSWDLCSSADAYLSFLPLAHIFERIIIQSAFSRGARVGFYQGVVPKVIDDVQELKPSFFVGVPRVYDKIYAKIVNLLPQQGRLKTWLFYRALDSMKDTLRTGKESALWNFLVLNKARQRMGGNVRAMLSGGAPLTPAVHKFLTCVFGCPIVQGYGLTETCAGATCGYVEDPTFDHVGAPIVCCEIKLVDVPELGYTSADELPRGEVLLRGPHISSGYFKDPEKTKESFINGWFHTGDIGRWNADGTLSIIDRKKNIFKLSHGEYIAVEKLEGVFSRSKFVSQIWVYGDSTKASLVAVVYPDPDALLPWARANSIPLSGDKEKDMGDLCANKKATEAVLKDVNQIGKEAKLRGFEFVTRLVLTPEEFSLSNDFITPTFKLKRPQLKKAFQKEIDEMYASIPD